MRLQYKPTLPHLCIAKSQEPQRGGLFKTFGTTKMKSLFSRLMVAFFVTFTAFSCLKDGSAVNPNQANGTLANAVAATDPTYYDVSYLATTNANIPVSQYVKRARVNLTAPSALASLLVGSLSGSLTTSQTAVWDIFKPKLQSNYPRTVTFNSTECVVYRGGSSFTPSSSAEYKFASPGIVRGVSSATDTNPARGVSLEVNYGLSYISGNGYKIKSLPAGLTIVLAGGDVAKARGHSEIVPIDNMPESTYLSKLSEITVEPAQ